MQYFTFFDKKKKIPSHSTAFQLDRYLTNSRYVKKVICSLVSGGNIKKYCSKLFSIFCSCLFHIVEPKTHKYLFFHILCIYLGFTKFLNIKNFYERKVLVLLPLYSVSVENFKLFQKNKKFSR